MMEKLLNYIENFKHRFKAQSQSFASTDELFQATVASVIQGDYDYYDDGDDFFADEVI